MDKKPSKVRGFNRANLLSWIISLEKDGFVLCSFKNCNYMAFDIDEMSLHYSTCILDPQCFSFACEICKRGCDSAEKILKHRVLHHPNSVTHKDIQEFFDKEDVLLPGSRPDREISKVTHRSWEIFLETKGYIKCLIPTCLFVTNTINEMECHYNRYCTPFYRNTYNYTCFYCHGRFDDLENLKMHKKKCNPRSSMSKNVVTPGMCLHWSKILTTYNWARCFTPGCFFIDCDIGALKAHYATCFNGKNENLVTCNGCHGRLNGINKLIMHIKNAHDPSNPKPITYMRRTDYTDATNPPPNPPSSSKQSSKYISSRQSNSELEESDETSETPESSLSTEAFSQNDLPNSDASNKQQIDCTESVLENVYVSQEKVKKYGKQENIKVVNEWVLDLPYVEKKNRSASASSIKGTDGVFVNTTLDEEYDVEYDDGVDSDQTWPHANNSKGNKDIASSEDVHLKEKTCKHNLAKTDCGKCQVEVKSGLFETTHNNESGNNNSDSEGSDRLYINCADDEPNESNRHSVDPLMGNIKKNLSMGESSSLSLNKSRDGRQSVSKDSTKLNENSHSKEDKMKKGLKRKSEIDCPNLIAENYFTESEPKRDVRETSGHEVDLSLSSLLENNKIYLNKCSPLHTSKHKGGESHENNLPNSNKVHEVSSKKQKLDTDGEASDRSVRETLDKSKVIQEDKQSQEAPDDTATDLRKDLDSSMQEENSKDHKVTGKVAPVELSNEIKHEGNNGLVAPNITSESCMNSGNETNNTVDSEQMEALNLKVLRRVESEDSDGKLSKNKEVGGTVTKDVCNTADSTSNKLENDSAKVSVNTSEVNETAKVQDTPVKKGRGRKRKSSTVQRIPPAEESDYILPHDITSIDDFEKIEPKKEVVDDYEPKEDFQRAVSERRERSRRRSDLIVPDDLSSVDDSEPVPLGPAMRASRRSARLTMTPSLPHFPTVHMRSQRQKSSALDILDSLGERITTASFVTKPDKKVQCAICHVEMTAIEYQSVHLVKHNFMCWLEGEVPLPLDDYGVMALIINRGKRCFPKHSLSCEKCGTSKKSAMGFISHVQFCGKSFEEMKSMKVSCTICHKAFKPSCMEQHLVQMHRVTTDMPMESPVDKTRAAARNNSLVNKLNDAAGSEFDDPDSNVASGDNSNYVPDYETSALNTQWKEALAKENIIFCPTVGCEFASGSLTEMKNHHKKCQVNGPYQPFLCKKCSFKSQSKESLKTHIKLEHSSLNNPASEAVFPIPFLKTVEDEMYSSFTWIRQTSFLRPAVHWTKDLRKRMLSDELLFPDLQVIRENWILLEDTEPYLPVLNESMCIKFESSEWTKLHMFGTLSEQGSSSVLWSGGPVWSLAWCPTPDGLLRDQYLAVSSHTAPSLSYQIGQIYSHPSTIQLWSFGLLMNNRPREEEPMLSYSVCVDEGGIWDMAWCPSGCHDERRLGLLAAAFSSGSILIFALPHPYQLPPTDSSVPMYHVSPLIKLQLPGNQTSQCRRVSWSKVKPHKVVVGGYVSGLVAVWDLSVSSTLLRHGSILFPCKVFLAHTSTVSCLSMSPLSNDYLLTGSMDRTLKVWDLRDTTGALQIVSKGSYTDATWLSHWLGYVAGIDAGYMNSASTGMFNSLRDISFLPAALLNSITSTVMSVSTCDWLNCAAFSFEDGHVAAVFGIRQLGDGTEATKKRAKFVVKSKLKVLNREAQQPKKKNVNKLELNIPKNSRSYEETASMYGVHISLSKNIEDFKPMKPDEDVRHDIYSVQCANKVCFNPNTQSFLSFAVGYESGFVVIPTLTLPKNAVAMVEDITPKS